MGYSSRVLCWRILGMWCMQLGEEHGLLITLYAMEPRWAPAWPPPIVYMHSLTEEVLPQWTTWLQLWKKTRSLHSTDRFRIQLPCQRGIWISKSRILSLNTLRWTWNHLDYASRLIKTFQVWCKSTHYMGFKFQSSPRTQQLRKQWKKMSIE